MATISTSRATMPKINGQLRVGKPKRHVLSIPERVEIQRAIKSLEKALDATDKTTFLLHSGDAFMRTRKIMMLYKQQ